MSKQAGLVSGYVFKRLAQWKSRAESSQTRAELAQLRRGIGKKPGELPELWGVIFADLPEALMSSGGAPSNAEWAIYISLTMYALHQQSSNVGSEKVSKEGMPLGRAVRCLAPAICSDDDAELERVRKRFNIFATAADIQECAHYLRGLVQLLRSEGVPLDYPALARDLYYYQFPDAVAKVRLRWGEDFYRMYKTNNEAESGKDEENV